MLRGQHTLKQSIPQKNDFAVLYNSTVDTASRTLFFGCDCQDIAGDALTHTVAGKHTDAVALGWTQIHHCQQGQSGIGDLAAHCSVPGRCEGGTQSQRDVSC